jgi:hypothetical protein
MNRTFRQAVVSGFLVNPICQLYLAWVAPRVQICHLVGKSKLWEIVENVLKATCHFMILAPIQIPILLGCTEYLKNLNQEAAKASIEDKFAQTFRLGIHFWPFANFLVY